MKTDQHGSGSAFFRVYPCASVAASCLSFQEAVARPALEHLAALPESRWPALLAYTDRTGLTLHLYARLEAAGLTAGLPSGVREGLASRAVKNRARLARLLEEAVRLLETFRAAGLRAAVLKGFTLEPHFVPSAALRAQYDLDFYLSPADAAAAHRLLRGQGYEPIGGEEDGPTIHLPTLVRKTGWEWRGDYFDLEIPISVELHSRLWHPEFERMPADLEADPLSRLEVRRIGASEFPVFSPPDQLGSVVLHLMRHLFRGSLRPSHLYELAYYVGWALAKPAQGAGRSPASALRWFWPPVQPPSLHKLTAVAFAIASQIFGAQTADTQECLSYAMEAWVARFSSTVLDQKNSSKCEALLQLALVEGWKNRAVVLRRRLLPLRLPAPVDAVHLPESNLSFRRRLLRQARQARYVLGRAWFHLRSLPGFALAAALWLWDISWPSRARRPVPLPHDPSAK